jgi:uncharacterized peroxidase-related enzyme
VRLSEVERGDSWRRRCLIGFISAIAGMRLPDAARAIWYHQAFFGGPMAAWAQAAMRGPGAWSVAERELMAAMIARWNSCAFCVGAHSAVAAKAEASLPVAAVVEDFERAPISDCLKAALRFLRTLTLTPEALTVEDARAVLGSGVTREALEDAIAVAALFNITTRYADALGFAVPTDEEFRRSATMLLKRGYSA